MSYFTETFESILEMKKDIEAAYSVNRAAEKLSGNHQYGKAAKNAAKVYNARGYVTHKQNAGNTKHLADHINAHGRRSVDGEFNRVLKHEEEPRRDYHKFNNAGRGRGLKEGYDPVYEDLCRMGVID